MNLEFLDSLSEVVKRVRRAQGPSVSRPDAVERVVAALPAKTVRGMAAAYLLEECQRLDRVASLQVERSAEVVDMHERPSRQRSSKRTPPPSPDPKLVEAEREIEKKKWRAIAAIVEQYTEDIRMQWTAELLDTSFARPDGTLVTWAAATVADHQQRREMFLQNAHGNLEGAARHEHAIRDLERAHASCLAELVKDAA